MMEDKRCCGSCCHFEHEDGDGWGICPFRGFPAGYPMYCGDLCETG